MICGAIIKTAERYNRLILQSNTFSLSKVLDIYKKTALNKTFGGEVSDYLNEYVAYRQRLFTNDIDRGDLKSEHDLNEKFEEKLFIENKRSLFDY